MKILWLFVVVQTALSQPGFGTSYLGNSKLCHQWSCLNTKLGLSDSLPTYEEYDNVLRKLLPSGEWQGVVNKVLDTCYKERPRRYSNTCPGQAMMHCAFDQLIANCPEANVRKDDACAPVTSLAGLNKMFSQSRYENMERNMPAESRPVWFLRNYFNTKCCNLPELFNSTTLTECGFTSMIQYYVHNLQIQRPVVLPAQRRDFPTTPANNGNTLQVVSLEGLQAANISQDTSIDPLDCCDISDFIQPNWRRECNFELNWEDQNRLVIKHEAPATTSSAPVTTSSSSPAIRKDVIVVPQSCEQETCVFNKLNILTSTGTVDIDAFTKLLDNLTNAQPSWNSAKGRVVTTCLRKPITEYDDQCEINKILACTFDVLTENCPFVTKGGLCKHTTSDSQRICQISSSKYRPKHRRDICTLPELVDQNILTECGLASLSKMKPVMTSTKPKSYRLFTSKNKCQDLTPSTSCVMTKMGILNKYGFMDYFKMKDRLRQFASQNEGILENVYMGAFNNAPLYYIERCNSPKKFLNVLDSMLMTCPDTKRKNTEQCARIFNKITSTPATAINVNQEYTQQVLNHFLNVLNTPKAQVIRPKHMRKLKKKPIYNYGILNDNFAPKVTTIDVKPKVVQQPLVLLPVYMRIPLSNLSIRRPFNEDGVMRSGFSLHNQIAQAHISTTSNTVSSSHSVSTTPVSSSQSVSTTPVSSSQSVSTTPVSSSQSVSTTTVSSSQFVSTTPVPSSQRISTISTILYENDSKFDMIKPE